MGGYSGEFFYALYISPYSASISSSKPNAASS
jgi:hypothetical protein